MASVDTSDRLLRWLQVGAADACVCMAGTKSRCDPGPTVLVSRTSVRRRSARHTAAHCVVLLPADHLKRTQTDSMHICVCYRYQPAACAP